MAVAIGAVALGGTRALRHALGDVVAHRFAAYRILSDTLAADLGSMDALGQIMEAASLRSTGPGRHRK